MLAHSTVTSMCRQSVATAEPSADLQTFAIMGGLYAGVNCFMKRLRQKDDGTLHAACVYHACNLCTLHFLHVFTLDAGVTLQLSMELLLGVQLGWYWRGEVLPCLTDRSDAQPLVHKYAGIQGLFEVVPCGHTCTALLDVALSRRLMVAFTLCQSLVKWQHISCQQQVSSLGSCGFCTRLSADLSFLIKVNGKSWGMDAAWRSNL